MYTKLSVISIKPKIMFMKKQNNDKPWITYNNESLEIVESFTYTLEWMESYMEWMCYPLPKGKKEYNMHLKTHEIMEKLSVSHY